MSGTIKDLRLNYVPVNSSNTFSAGDVLNGTVILELNKEAKIGCFYVKFKGDANVHWTERHNDRTYSYSAHERYFKLKQIFIQDPNNKERQEPGVIMSPGETYSNVVKPGNHVYPFSFQLPQGNFPASFRGCHGSVKYILEVTLDRSWRMDETAKQELTVVPRFFCAGTNLMNPQSGAISKKMKLFTSGSASLTATLNKLGFSPGEVIKISTDIDNSSSRDLKLKYSLEQRQTFHAQGRTKHSSKNIFKVVGDPIPAGSKQTVNRDLVLPSYLELSITTSNIIKVEYTLTVYLDVPYASDPEVVFPVVILPAGMQMAPLLNQPGLPPTVIPGAPGWNQPLAQPLYGPGLTNPGLEPVPGQYPNVHPAPMYQDPGAPPPAYTDIYPNPIPIAPGFSAAPSGPGFNPPQFPVMGFPNPTIPQQHPAPSAPQFCPDPSVPGYMTAGGAPGYWPNPTAPAPQQDPYPTKTPEKHE